MAKKAHKEDKTLKESVVELGFIKSSEYDSIVKPEKMI